MGQLGRSPTGQCEALGSWHHWGGNKGTSFKGVRKERARSVLSPAARLQTELGSSATLSRPRSFSLFDVWGQAEPSLSSVERHRLPRPRQLGRSLWCWGVVRGVG